MRQEDRLVILETVREYAVEHLAEDPDGDTVWLRLGQWCGELAGETTPDLRRTSRIAALARLDAELPNVLGVLSWALDQGRWELLMRLLAEFCDYWWLTNRWHDGRPWFDAALDRATDASDLARARALLGRGRLADLHCTYEPVRAVYEASLRLFRAYDDAAGIAACLAHLAWLEAWRGRHHRAGALGEEAIRFARHTQDDSLLAFALAIDAIARPDHTQAAERAHVALAHLQAVGDLYGIAEVSVAVGYMAIIDRRYQDALDLLDAGLEAARRLAAPFGVFHIRTTQGLARPFLDDLDAAAVAFHDALAVCRDAGAQDIVDETLLGLGVVEASRGDCDRAARLTGAALRHESAERGVGEEAIWSQLLELLGRARKDCGPKTWDTAARHGKALSVPDAIDLGLSHERFEPPTPATGGAPQT
jgi:hypothetical protein